MLATKNGHTDVVKPLLEAKADPNLREKVRVQCACMVPRLIIISSSFIIFHMNYRILDGAHCFSRLKEVILKLPNS